MKLNRKKIIAAFASAVLFGALPLEGRAAENDVNELTRKVNILTEEVEKLKLGEVADDTYESFSGLGPAASKVYGKRSGLSIGGYGEFFYTNYLDDTKKDKADTLRFILYTGYKFTDNIVLNAELEFEHANESFVEFLYVDFLLNPAFNLRPGLVLVPMGIVNEFHEPTTFHGVNRPEVERNVIPTTWRDLGLMVHGEVGNLSYKAAVLNGLKSDSFRKADWIRNGRFKGTDANAESLAYVLSLEYGVTEGFSVGGSYYFGEAGAGAGGSVVSAADRNADIDLWEVHAIFRQKGLELRGLYVEGKLDGNSAFEAAPPGTTTSGTPPVNDYTNAVGKKARGWYVEAAYDVMPHIKPMSEAALTPFVRYEDYDTHHEVFAGVAKDPTQHRKITTIGVGYKPIHNVVIKADYQIRDTDSALPEGKSSTPGVFDENKIDQFNLGVGFIF